MLKVDNIISLERVVVSNGNCNTLYMLVYLYTESLPLLE